MSMTSSLGKAQLIRSESMNGLINFYHFHSFEFLILRL